MKKKIFTVCLVMSVICLAAVFASDSNGITKDYELADDLTVSFPKFYLTDFAGSYNHAVLAGAGSTFQLKDVKVDLFGGIDTNLAFNESFYLEPVVVAKAEYPFGNWDASVALQYSFSKFIKIGSGSGNFKTEKGVFLSQRLAYTCEKGLVLSEVFDTDFSTSVLSFIATHDVSFENYDVYGTVGTRVKFETPIKFLPFCDFSFERLSIVPDSELFSSNNLGAFIAYTDSSDFQVGAQIRTTIADAMTLRFRLGCSVDDTKKPAFYFGVAY